MVLRLMAEGQSHPNRLGLPIPVLLRYCRKPSNLSWSKGPSPGDCCGCLHGPWHVSRPVTIPLWALAKTYPAHPLIPVQRNRLLGRISPEAPPSHRSLWGWEAGGKGTTGSGQDGTLTPARQSGLSPGWSRVLVSTVLLICCVTFGKMCLL